MSPRNSDSAPGRTADRTKTATYDADVPNSKRDARRSSMLAAAARHFMHAGYAATSMDDIAATVGVTKGTLYYYFPSKSDLLYQIYGSVMENSLGRIRSQPTDLDPRSRLRATLQSMLQLIEEQPLETSVYLQEGPLLQQFLTRDQARELRRRETEFADFFEDILRAGIAAGQFRSIDVEVAALGIIGMAAWVRRWYSETGRLGVSHIADIFADMIIAGLASPPDPPPQEKA